MLILILTYQCIGARYKYVCWYICRLNWNKSPTLHSHFLRHPIQFCRRAASEAKVYALLYTAQLFSPRNVRCFFLYCLYRTEHVNCTHFCVHGMDLTMCTRFRGHNTSTTKCNYNLILLAVQRICRYFPPHERTWKREPLNRRT